MSNPKLQDYSSEKVQAKVDQILEQVESELQYWEVIEGLGGFIWRMNHDMADGRINDPKGQLGSEVFFMQQVIESLVCGLFERYGVIHPKDCPKVECGQTPPEAPEGMTYYWDWYQRMKQESYSQEYAGMICAACPYSEGVERFMGLGGTIPCSLFPGMCYHLRTPFACCMIGEDRRFEYTMEQFMEKLLAEHGPAVMAGFAAQHLALQQKHAQVSERS